MATVVTPVAMSADVPIFDRPLPWGPEREGVLTLDGGKHQLRQHDYVYEPPGIRYSFTITGVSGLVFLVITTPVDDEGETL